MGMMLDWRVVVLGAVLLLAAYLIYALVRLSQMKRRQPDREAGGTEPPPVPQAPTLPPPPAQPPAGNPSDFAMRQFLMGVEAELEQVRRELAALRGEVAHLKAARQTSPHYAEAMAMAGRGADPRTVAEQCGISQSEAELVLALARRHPAREED